MPEDRKEFVEKLKKRMLDYSVLVTKFVDGLPRNLSNTILARQLLRSATSIGANFIEAQVAASTKDFTNFLSIALKSANETLYWLSIFRESHKGSQQVLVALQKETFELANILGSIVSSLKKKVYI